MIDSGKIKDYCSSHGYGYRKCGNAPRLLLIGEKHGNMEHIASQEELIDMLRPEMVLHESYDPLVLDRALKNKMKLGPSLPMDYYIHLTLKKWAETYWCKVERGDMSVKNKDGMRRGMEKILTRNKDWPKVLMGKGRGQLHSQYPHYFMRMIAEPVMGYLAQQALKRARGDVIGIYGAFHLGPSSHLHHVLKNTFPPLYQWDDELPLTDKEEFYVQDYVLICQDSRAVDETPGFYERP